MNIIERMTAARPAHAAPERVVETVEFLIDRADRLAKMKEPVTVEPTASYETPAAQHTRLIKQINKARHGNTDNAT